MIPEDDLPFVELTMAPLSDRDRDVFLALLDNSPQPNDALRRLLTSENDHSDQGATDSSSQSGQFDPISLS